MKNLLEKVQTLEKTILTLEMELRLYNNDLNMLKYNLKQLYGMKNRLSENIKVLKKDKIVAVASEYRKSSTDLNHVIASLNKYEAIEEDFELKIENLKLIHEKTMDEYNEAKSDLDNEKVILLFDPKKRKKK